MEFESNVDDAPVDTEEEAAQMMGTEEDITIAETGAVESADEAIERGVIEGVAAEDEATEEATEEEVIEEEVTDVPLADDAGDSESDGDALGDEEAAAEDDVLPAELLQPAEVSDSPVPQERSPMEDISDEDVDALADAAIAAIHEVLKRFPVEEYTIEEYEGDEGELILDIVGEDLNILIGRHGRTAEALQVVVSAIASRSCNVFYPITVDVEGYKHRRKQRVIEIAQKVVERVRDTGRPVSLKPMTPAERRQVHMSLREVRGVTTTSEGSGSYRHVVVLPAE